ncbi:MAG: hypothetical protein HY369_01590 [Candidatus Aenigmarchaeota archaeon]|nr:hypothetical protein [Candidatus Aenigmarchaeota archaeon]
MAGDEEAGRAVHARLEALEQLGAEAKVLLLAQERRRVAQDAVLSRVEARLDDLLEVVAARLGVGRAEMAKLAAVRALREAAARLAKATGPACDDCTPSSGGAQGQGDVRPS